MNTPSQTPPAPQPPVPPWHADLLSLKIEMMKMLGGAFAAFSLILGLLGYFGFQQVMSKQLDEWAKHEFKAEIEASKALAKSAAQDANKSLGEVNVILADLRAKAVVPVGTIVPWFPPSIPKAGEPLGAVVPRGWALCDGSNGTPNLQDRFVRGTLDPKSINQEGGSKTHNHSASFSGTRFEADNIGRNGTGATRHDGNVISISEAETLPLYTTLAYIMKLP